MAGTVAQHHLNEAEGEEVIITHRLYIYIYQP